MLDTVAEIFASNSDKARFISILVSAIVAVSIFLLSQYFVRRRDRRDLMIEKIEQLHAAILEYEEHTYDAFTTCFYPDEPTAKSMRSSVGSAISAVRKARTLSQLYFPNINIEKEELYQLTHKFVPILEEKYGEGGFAAVEDYLDKPFDAVKEKVSEIELQLKVEMDRYRH